MTMFFFFQAEDGIRYYKVTGVQTCALPISVNAAANQMAKRVTTKSVAAEQNHVHRQHHSPETDAEGVLASRRVGKPHCFPDIVAEENQKEQRHIQKVSVNVLHEIGRASCRERV